MLGTVVGSRDDERVLREAAIFENPHDFTEHRIALEEPVGITPGVRLAFQLPPRNIDSAALPDELRRRRNRVMRCAQREV